MKKFTSILVFVIIAGMVMCLAAPCFGQMRGRETRMMGRYAPFNYDLISKYIPEEISIKTISNTWYSVSGIYVRLMPMGIPELMGIHNTLELKSVHTNENIYIYATWPDYTKSVNSKMWVKQEDGTWKNSTDDEDRISFIWEIGDSMIGFSQGRGCVALCHPDPKDPYKGIMSTRYIGGLADVWHWKAARTNPAGFADDQYMDQEKRKNDPGEAAYKENIEKQGASPAFMFADGTGASPFLFASEAKPFNDSRFKSGDKLPAFVLKTPTGDRADIEAYGIYKDGFWTVILKRPLNTRHNTDVQFVSGKEYNFSAAIFDNAGDQYHLKTQLLRIFLERVAR